MDNVLGCLLALLFTGGSLLVYFAGTAVSQLRLNEEGKTVVSFNLRLPDQNREDLFAMSIVSAGTTLSTVSVFFLTRAGHYGLHLFFCPVAFGLGLALMLWLYTRVSQLGYIDDSAVAGLIPALGYRMTRSRSVAVSLALVSAIPMLALLTLEIHYGVLFLEYLLRPLVGSHDWNLQAFVVFIALLMGYVFLGGFRAVVASDVLQYRAMTIALFFVVASAGAMAFSNLHTLNWAALPTMARGQIYDFYSVILILNLLVPLSLASNWQRFQAFHLAHTDLQRAMKSAIRKAVPLWITLVTIGIIIAILPVGPTADAGHPKALVSDVLKAGASKGTPNDPISPFLNRLTSQNDWFKLFVFPLLVLGAMSGMYSTSDTCISALFYLTESGRTWRADQRDDKPETPLHYYLLMAALFICALAIYALMMAHRTLPIEDIAFDVFNNSVIIAPTVVLLAVLPALTTERVYRWRKVGIMLSIAAGLIAIAVCKFTGEPLSRWSILISLMGASVPAVLLVIYEIIGSKREHGRRS